MAGIHNIILTMVASHGDKEVKNKTVTCMA